MVQTASGSYSAADLLKNSRHLNVARCCCVKELVCGHEVSWQNRGDDKMSEMCGKHPPVVFMCVTAVVHGYQIHSSEDNWQDLQLVIVANVQQTTCGISMFNFCY